MSEVNFHRIILDISSNWVHFPLHFFTLFFLTRFQPTRILLDFYRPSTTYAFFTSWFCTAQRASGSYVPFTLLCCCCYGTCTYAAHYSISSKAVLATICTSFDYLHYAGCLWPFDHRAPCPFCPNCAHCCCLNYHLLFPSQLHRFRDGGVPLPSLLPWHARARAWRRRLCWCRWGGSGWAKEGGRTSRPAPTSATFDRNCDLPPDGPAAPAGAPAGVPQDGVHVDVIIAGGCTAGWCPCGRDPRRRVWVSEGERSDLATSTQVGDFWPEPRSATRWTCCASWRAGGCTAGWCPCGRDPRRRVYRRMVSLWTWSSPAGVGERRREVGPRDQHPRRRLLTGTTICHPMDLLRQLARRRVYRRMVSMWTWSSPEGVPHDGVSCGRDPRRRVHRRMVTLWTWSSPEGAPQDGGPVDVIFAGGYTAGWCPCGRDHRRRRVYRRIVSLWCGRTVWCGRTLPGAQHPAAARHPNCVIGASCHDDSMFVVKRIGCLNSWSILSVRFADISIFIPDGATETPS